MHKKANNIITIGASAGGIAAVSKLLSTFNEHLDASVFIVIHVFRNSLIEVILNQIQRQSPLKCMIPQDGDRIVSGHIYLAPADHHMTLEMDKILVRKGKLENHWRPSIDVLFQSAAMHYGSSVTGIILTGLLDDGTAGMKAIKKNGGMCIVQDPVEADFPDMPKNVLQHLLVDYQVPIADMSYIIVDLLSRQRRSGELTSPAELELKSESPPGLLTPFTCTDCGAALVKTDRDSGPRYQCQAGHIFTERTLLREQARSLENSLWVAVRMMEEQRALLSSISDQDVEVTTQQAGNLVIQIERLKKILASFECSEEQ